MCEREASSACALAHVCKEEEEEGEEGMSLTEASPSHAVASQGAPFRDPGAHAPLVHDARVLEVQKEQRGRARGTARFQVQLGLRRRGGAAGSDFDGGGNQHRRTAGVSGARLLCSTPHHVRAAALRSGFDGHHVLPALR